jgi:hypothetical protein
MADRAETFYLSTGRILTEALLPTGGVLILYFLDPLAAPEVQKGIGSSEKAIVTLVVGEAYMRVWQTACRASWEAYAARHGYDLIVITDLFDRSERGRERSPAWQKLLILEQVWADHYHQIVWVDADIIISAHAPDIVHCLTMTDRIGVCRAGAQMSPAETHIYLERLYRMPIDPTVAAVICRLHHHGQYANAGLADCEAPMLSTGVFVVSPAHHRAVLAAIYDGTSESRLYEQPLFSHILAAQGLSEELTPRFNWSVHDWLTVHFSSHTRSADEPPLDVSPAEIQLIIHGVLGELAKAYFLHFSGSMPMLQLFADVHCTEPARC